MNPRKSVLLWAALGVYLVATAMLSQVPRTQFGSLVLWAGLAFATWAALYALRKGLRWWHVVLTFVMARLPFFFGLPLLSDDFYRFLWDGMLTCTGINPFGAVPLDTVARLPVAVDAGYAEALLSGMNSAGYPSVYPLGHQVVFALGAWLGGSDLLAGVNAMRAAVAVVEIGVGVFLWKRGGALALAYALYLLNPLTVAEGVGNVHFEAVYVPMLALLVFAVRRGRAAGGGLAWAGAVLTKLSPLMLAPALFHRWRGGGRWVFLGVSAAVVALGFAALRTWAHAAAFDGGLGLYFRSFEFNASVYYAVRAVGAWLVGYNPIATVGPAMGVLALLAILAVSWRGRRARFSEVALVVYVVYLLLSTTVHPWYVLPVVFFALAADRPLVAVWSLTVFLSYSHYLPPLGPKTVFIAVEYGLLVLALVAEGKRRGWLRGDVGER